MTEKTTPEKSSGLAPGMEASFSTLVLSIASSAAMSLGLAPNPASGQIEKDTELARFNIDLLSMLAEKTKGNRTPDEERFISTILQDLKMKFIQGS